MNWRPAPRIAGPLSFLKSAMVLKSGVRRPVSHISSTLRWVSRSSRRPTSPLLFEYGRDFPDFIDSYEYAKPTLWLADVARIERAWLDAYHAANADPLMPQVLASIPPERLADTILITHPATRIVRSRFPAGTLFTAN